MTPLDYTRATGKAPPLAMKLASVTSAEELDGFEAQVRADGRANAALLRDIEKRRVQLSKGVRR